MLDFVTLNFSIAKSHIEDWLLKIASPLTTVILETENVIINEIKWKLSLEWSRNVYVDNSPTTVDYIGWQLVRTSCTSCYGSLFLQAENLTTDFPGSVTYPLVSEGNSNVKSIEKFKNTLLIDFTANSHIKPLEIVFQDEVAVIQWQSLLSA